MSKEETHISILTETKVKLQEIADKERRSMRAVVKKLIDDAHKKVIG